MSMNLKREARQAKREAREGEKKEKEAKSGKKLEVNLEYVKLKARKQYMSEKQRQNAKRNNNKDKGMMKMKEDVKDCLMDDF